MVTRDYRGGGTVALENRPVVALPEQTLAGQINAPAARVI
jgi:hypothetical protein